jgi:hypothetical protein
MHGQHLLHEILEQQLGVGLHGTKVLLGMGEMLMIFHSEERIGTMNLIPIVSTLLHRQEYE